VSRLPEGLKRNSRIRRHHLIKTFCVGFSDHQLPNGDIVVTYRGT
jgi:hypothetical protein